MICCTIITKSFREVCTISKSKTNRSVIVVTSLIITKQKDLQKLWHKFCLMAIKQLLIQMLRLTSKYESKLWIKILAINRKGDVNYIDIV